MESVAMCLIAIALSAVSFAGLIYISRQISSSSGDCESIHNLCRSESRRIERRLDDLCKEVTEHEVVIFDHRKMIDRRVRLGTLYGTVTPTGKVGRRIRIVHDDDPDYDAKEA